MFLHDVYPSKQSGSKLNSIALSNIMVILVKPYDEINAELVKEVDQIKHKRVQLKKNLEDEKEKETKQNEEYHTLQQKHNEISSFVKRIDDHYQVRKIEHADEIDNIEADLKTLKERNFSLENKIKCRDSRFSMTETPQAKSF